jgi:RNA polymerase sigma factor (sigma-70 family)
MKGFGRASVQHSRRSILRAIRRQFGEIFLGRRTKAGNMTRLQTAGAPAPRDRRATYTPGQHVDFTGLNSPPLLILAQEEASAARRQPRREGGMKLMSNNDTRVSVLIGACQGDPDRWHEFDAIYRPMLFTYLLKQRLSQFDADDVVRQIFVKLLGKIHTYDRTICKFRSWLFSVAHNTLIDLARRRASHKKAVDEWVINVLRATPSDSLRMAEEWVKLHRSKILAHALETVRRRSSPRAWACFEQRLLHDRPGAVIAAELNMEVNVVYVNAKRVLERVRIVCQEFDEDLTDDDDAGLSRRD